MVRRIFRQYESHRQLIASVRSAAGRSGGSGLDAIIVPASRHASNLDHAVTLARAAECKLVVFCSRKTRVADVEKLLADRRFSDAAVVKLPEGYRHSLLQFDSSDFARTGLAELFVNPNGDLSTKRNLGLLLARMVGWNRIFFMDDDVRDITPDDLAATVTQLGRYRSVGMRVIEVPDNSVVCHAHRATGADQDIFVSGSVLAVRLHEQMGFFPEIYNEDWFFFHDDVQSRRLGWSGRNATQLHYDPFGTTQRAARQEFGDLLAEGLYTLLHLGEEKRAAEPEFWAAFLDERQSFLRNILNRSKRAAPDTRGKMTDAVRTAMGSLKQVKPQMCEEYIRAWRGDLKTWHDSLASLPAGLSVDSALKQVGLSAAKGRGLARRTSSAPAAAHRNGPPRPVRIPGVPTAGLPQGRINGASRGLLRRSRDSALASLHSLVPGIQRTPAEAAAREEAPRAEARAGARTTPVGSVDFRTATVNLTEVADAFIDEGQLAEDQKALASP